MSIHSRQPLFDRLKAGLEEGIAHAKGELPLHTVEIPEKHPEVDKQTFIALRQAAQMSRAFWGRVLGEGQSDFGPSSIERPDSES